MTVSLVPPFQVALKHLEGPSLVPNELNLTELRAVVSGKASTFPRARAMALLQLSNLPDKHLDFEAVLGNEQELPEMRYLAAINLGKINTPAAIDILTRNSQIRDQQVLAGVMKALGRIGGQAALDAVVRARAHATGLAATWAAFAALLISHRLGLAGDEAPLPNPGSYLELPSERTSPLSLSRPDNNEVAICLHTLANQPFGIDYTEHLMYQIRCERRMLMILFNRNFTGHDAVNKLRTHKSFLGVVATRSEETGLYSTALLLLTSPARQADTVNLLIHRATGELIFGGTCQVRADRLMFVIGAFPRPGAFAVQIEGTFEAGQLEFNAAQSALFVQMPKRQPLNGRDIVGRTISQTKGR